MPGLGCSISFYSGMKRSMLAYLPHITRLLCCLSSASEPRKEKENSLIITSRTKKTLTRQHFTTIQEDPDWIINNKIPRLLFIAAI